MSRPQAETGESAGLYREVLGSGPDLVLVHGWGMHAGAWDGIKQPLAEHFRVTLLDLPGHGHSPATADFDLPSLRRDLSAAAPAEALWLGWSLGGMACLDLATHRPERVRGLVLVAATPRFVRSADWPWAMDPEVLAGFGTDLERDHAGTLQRFLALQVRGADDSRETLRQLRRSWSARPPPRGDALAGGLRLLQQCDLRDHLPQIRCPSLVVLGERDALVPAAVAAPLCERLPQSRVRLMAGAGHAPFVSDPAGFVAAVCDFADDLGRGVDSVADVPV